MGVRVAGPLAALAVPRFRAHIIVQLACAVAVWVHVVAVQWILTERGEPASVVALAPAAMALPFLLLSLPAGVIVGYAVREGLMRWAAVAAAAAAATALVLTATDAGREGGGTWPLLATVLAVGVALTIVGVSWQSLLPETLERRLVPVATVADGAVFNIARALGPLLAGLLLGLSSPWVTFGLVWSLFSGCALGLLRVQRRWPGRRGPRRPLLPAIAGALRFVRYSAWTTRLLLRMVLFGLPASALWALVPLVAHDRLALGSAGFGGVMALLGAGAIVATLVLAPLRRRLPVRDFAALGSGAYAAVLAALGLTSDPVVVAPFLVLAGIAWVGVQSTWMMLAHQALPDWVRPRVIALLLLLFQGTQAVGALAWGIAADRVGLSRTLLAAAALMALSVAVLLRSGLGSSAGIEPVATEPDATVVEGLRATAHRGALQVAWTYEVSPRREEEFRTAMQALRLHRLRLGARAWSLTPVAGRSSTWSETYAVDDQDDLLDQETVRLTIPEQRIRAAVTSSVTRAEGPMLAPRPSKATRRRER